MGNSGASVRCIYFDISVCIRPILAADRQIRTRIRSIRVVMFNIKYVYNTVALFEIIDKHAICIYDKMYAISSPERNCSKLQHTVLALVRTVFVAIYHGPVMSSNCRNNFPPHFILSRT